MAKQKKHLFKNSKQKKSSSQTEKELKQKDTLEKVDTKEKKKEFPKIPRFIPELASFKSTISHISLPSYKNLFKKQRRTKTILAIVFIICALLLNGFTVGLLYKTYISWSEETTKRQQLYAQMQLWDNITKTYPSYRDAYFKGALLAYQLGDSGSLTYFLDKLHLLDPNFPLTNPLEKLDTVQQVEGR